MKNILALGAGLVARPLVQYLLDQPDFYVKVASRTLSKAEHLIGKHPRGQAQELDITNTSMLDKLVSQSDLVVSLLPNIHHVSVAKICLKYHKPMVTTSYVSDTMRALDEEVKKAGIIILNEIGLDPGIDHMSAMKIIHRIQKQGGTVKSFSSYCGGLPAPEANTNPFGYKFSWSPRGVVLAAKNKARYLKDKQEVVIPGEELFDHYSIMTIEELGNFEAYPNRDSLPYSKTYGISDTETMFRGTLRNLGWCQTWKKIAELGFLDEKERSDLKGFTFREFLRELIQSSAQSNVKRNLAKYLKIDENSEIMKRIEWLGLLSDDSLPLERGSALDILVARLWSKLQYQEGERDIIILRHEFIAEYPCPTGHPVKRATQQRKTASSATCRRGTEKIISTLIDFGISHGDSSMARTVGLPAAIGAKLILQGKINLTGIQIPISPGIYEPILQELEEQGITFKEKTEVLKS